MLIACLRERLGTKFSRAGAGQRIYFGQCRGLRGRAESSAPLPQPLPEAASQELDAERAWMQRLWMQRATLQSGHALSAPPSSPRTWGCRSGDPPVQRGLANERGCTGAAALMHSAGIVFLIPCSAPGIHPRDRHVLFSSALEVRDAVLGEEMGTASSPAPGVAWRASGASPCSVRLLPRLFPGELSSRPADLARNCRSPLQQEI